jgi:GNAT superfamily N-acetyltransferase
MVTSSSGRAGKLGASLVIRAVSVDDFSTIRHVHEQAFAKLAAPFVSDEEAEAFARYVRSPEYVERLMEGELVVGTIDGAIVGTAAWQPGDDQGATARISAVFVDPLFINSGIGRRLVTEVEARAAQSGFTRGSIRSTLFAVPFFLKLGYDVASQGVSSASGLRGAMPVTFMRKVIAATPAGGTRH